MNVSKNAWHYKVLMVEDQQKIQYGTNLCAYFWMVVVALLMWTAGIAAAVLVISAVGICAWLATYVWYFMIGGAFGIESFEVRNILLSLVVNGILIAAWLWSIFVRARSKRKKEVRESSNILVEYVKAKKQRICPIIEFEDD